MDAYASSSSPPLAHPPAPPLRFRTARPDRCPASTRGSRTSTTTLYARLLPRQCLFCARRTDSKSRLHRRALVSHKRRSGTLSPTHRLATPLHPATHTDHSLASDCCRLAPSKSPSRAARACRGDAAGYLDGTGGMHPSRPPATESERFVRVRASWCTEVGRKPSAFSF